MRSTAHTVLAIAIVMISAAGSCVLASFALMSACTVTYGTAVEQVAAGQHAALCVTHGLALSATDVATADPEFRAVAPATIGTSVDLLFVGQGETMPTVPLASGAIRHQICLKLRASDGCNLVYACWRLEPHPAIVVQTKSNPGQHTAAECGTAGYATPTPGWSAPTPTFDDGKAHELAANMEGASLEVRADGDLRWVGYVDPVAAAVVGPAGIRSDNERWYGSLAADIDCSGIGGE